MADIKFKECKTHGITKFRFEKDIKHNKDYGRYRCAKCRQEARNKSRRKKRKVLVKEFGGKCAKCGYHKCLDALHFHHTDPGTKEFSISDSQFSIERLRKEASKCILLCANCHIEEHAIKD